MADWPLNLRVWMSGVSGAAANRRLEASTNVIVLLLNHHAVTTAVTGEDDGEVPRMRRFRGNQTTIIGNIIVSRSAWKF